MREIKFRAWDVGKMFYTVSIGADINPSVYDGEWKECTEKAEIMQYTGLKDKNRVEIYEGDIIRFVKRDRGWGNALYRGYFMVTSSMVSGIELHGFYENAYCKLKGFFDEVEVVGNIYETTELIKKLK